MTQFCSKFDALSIRQSMVQNSSPRSLSAFFLCLNRRLSSSLPTTSAAAAAAAAAAASNIPEDLPSVIASIVLAHSPTSTTPQTLTLNLTSHLPSPLTPPLVDRVLKLLWDDGPRALLFFRSILPLLSPAPAASSLDLAADIAARCRDQKTLTLILDLRRKINLPLTRRTFAVLAERCAAHGKPDRAVRFFLNLHLHGCPQDLNTFNTLLDVLAKSRRVEKASGLLRALRGRFRADTVSYNIIADGWCRVKKTMKAMEVMKEMVEMGLEPSLNTYNILLKGFFRAGQVREGWDFFVQMKKRGRKGGDCCRPDVVSYTTVVHGLGIDGQIDRARKVFDEMIGEGVLPSVATYNALIQVICKKGCVENAVLVFDEMVRKGYTPNVITYNLLIRGLSHTGEMDRAVEFLERMKLEGCEPNVQTFNVLIRYWFEEGEIERGLELFETMGKKGSCLPNLDTYNTVISAMFARKRSEDMVVAGKMVVEMVERGHLPRRFMFNRVLNGLLLTGNQSFAKELLRMQDRFGRLRKEFRL